MRTILGLLSLVLVGCTIARYDSPEPVPLAEIPADYTQRECRFVGGYVPGPAGYEIAPGEYVQRDPVSHPRQQEWHWSGKKLVVCQHTPIAPPPDAT